MARENYNELLAFLTVARERSFTRAAARLGVSQSALSHCVRRLEERMGVRLLMRTTRFNSSALAPSAVTTTDEPSLPELQAEPVEMLKPRRANNDATRARTPNLFSTRAESVCFFLRGVMATGE